MIELTQIWPAIVVVEMGSLAFVAYDHSRKVKELERERSAANHALASCNIDVAGVQARIKDLQSSIQDLANERLELASLREAETDSVDIIEMDGLFDGIIASALEQRRIRRLKEVNLLKEGARLEARTTWLKRLAEREKTREDAIREETATRKVEAEKELRLRSLREHRDKLVEHGVQLEKLAAELSAQGADTSTSVRGLAHVDARIEVVQREFKGTMELLTEIDRLILEILKEP